MAGEPTSLDVLADALGAADFPVGAMSSPDGAVTLLLVALDDCPAIVAALGDDGAAIMLRNHRAVVEAAARSHEGQVVKVEQDAVMVSFTSSHAALRCAVGLQRTISQLEVAPVGRLRLRAGVHTGFVISSGQDVFGRNVVIAARVADQAAGGEILVSAAVRDYTASDPSLRYEDRGAVHFRGVHGEHELYRLDWAVS
jgi:class 3 adenylate cyclase